MPNSTNHEPLGQKQLNSWKEIAAYLRCGERTAKRWEKTRGLPVHRLPGGVSQVFAFCGELEIWRAGSWEQEAVVQASAPIPVSEEPPWAALLDVPSTEATSRISRFVPFLSAGGSRRSLAIRLGISSLCLAIIILPALWIGTHTRIGARRAAGHNPPEAARALYLSGRFYWNKRTPADLQHAMHDFQAAIAIDPQYAAAYAGMADVYALSPEFGKMAPREAYPRMLQAARKALALDPDTPEAHRALGFALFYWNWDRAASRAEFERAIALNATDATTFHWFANVLQQSGDAPAALKMIDKAQELNPFGMAILADRSLILLDLGRSTEAQSVWATLEKSDPTYLPPHWYASESAEFDHEAAPYLVELRAIAAISHTAADLEHFKECSEGFAKGGDEGLFVADADFKVRSVRANGSGYVVAAIALASVHRADEAIALLEQGYKERDPAFVIIAKPKFFTELDGNPLFDDLRSRSTMPYPNAVVASLSGVH